MMGVFNDIQNDDAYFAPRTDTDQQNMNEAVYGAQQKITGLWEESAKIVRDNTGSVVDEVDRFFCQNQTVQEGDAFWPPDVDHTDAAQKREIRDVSRLDKLGIETTVVSL